MLSTARETGQPAVAVPDTQLSAWPHDPLDHLTRATWGHASRIVAQVAVCEALGDEVAWAVIIGEERVWTVYRSLCDSKGRRKRGRS